MGGLQGLPREVFDGDDVEVLSQNLICGDDTNACGRFDGSVSKAGVTFQTKYICRGGYGTICVSAYGESIVLTFDNQKGIEYCGRFGYLAIVGQSYSGCGGKCQ